MGMRVKGTFIQSGSDDEVVELLINDEPVTTKGVPELVRRAGLGLSIAARAVRLHHGTIRASNAPDGGLMVEIKLPIVSPA